MRWFADPFYLSLALSLHLRRLDSVAGEVDKISFPRRNSGGIQNHNPDVNVVMMDLNRIRKDLSFKCDGR